MDSNFVEMSLDVLSPEEALELLTTLVGVERISQDVGARYALPLLCEWLDYQPLGLELVGQYLAQKPDLSLTQMLERLKAQRLQDKAIDECDRQLVSSTNQQGVKAAFELTWQELDAIAQRLGQMLSLFAPTVIPWKLVEILPTTSPQLNWTKIDVKQAREELERWHAIASVVEKKGCYKLHPLIREFLQAKLAASEQADHFRQIFAEAMVSIAHQIPDTPSCKAIGLMKDAIPHLEEVAQTLATAVNDEDLLWLFDRLGRFYKGQGLYARAEHWFVQCVSFAKVRMGDDHLDVAATLNNLAALYYAQQRYDEAELLYVQALELKKRLLGNDHLDIAANLNNLAFLYDARGRYSEAEPLLEQGLKLRKRFLGAEHPDVAASLHNLALLYCSQGRHGEAESLYLQALEQRRRLLGNDHPDVATTLNNLALLYNSQGQFSKAEALLVQALECSERVLGFHHPNTLIFRENLATFRAKTGKNLFRLRQLAKKFLTFV